MTDAYGGEVAYNRMRQVRYGEETYSERALQMLEKEVRMYVIKYDPERNLKLGGMTSDDLAQELRIQLWRKFDRYDPSKATSLRTWSHWVMRNRILDLAKRVKRGDRGPLDALDGPTVPYEDLSSDDEDEAYNWA